MNKMKFLLATVFLFSAGTSLLALPGAGFSRESFEDPYGFNEQQGEESRAQERAHKATAANPGSDIAASSLARHTTESNLPREDQQPAVVSSAASAAIDTTAEQNDGDALPADQLAECQRKVQEIMEDFDSRDFSHLVETLRRDASEYEEQCQRKIGRYAKKFLKATNPDTILTHNSASFTYYFHQAAEEAQKENPDRERIKNFYIAGNLSYKAVEEYEAGNGTQEDRIKRATYFENAAWDAFKRNPDIRSEKLKEDMSQRANYLTAAIETDALVKEAKRKAAQNRRNSNSRHEEVLPLFEKAIDRHKKAINEHLRVESINREMSQADAQNNLSPRERRDLENEKSLRAILANIYIEQALAFRNLAQENQRTDLKNNKKDYLSKAITFHELAEGCLLNPKGEMVPPLHHRVNEASLLTSAGAALRLAANQDNENLRKILFGSAQLFKEAVTSFRKNQKNQQDPILGHPETCYSFATEICGLVKKTIDMNIVSGPLRTKINEALGHYQKGLDKLNELKEKNLTERLNAAAPHMLAGRNLLPSIEALLAAFQNQNATVKAAAK